MKTPEKEAMIEREKNWREWVRENRPDYEKLIIQYNAMMRRKREDSNKWQSDNKGDLHDMIRNIQENRPPEEKPVVGPSDREMDFIITSASRPQVITLLRSFQKKVVFSGKFNMYLHEDVVPGMEKGSRRLVKYAEESGLFEKIFVSNPRIGRGPALNKLKEYIKTDYIFYTEEDFEFMRYINVDALVDIMEKYDKINQIAFANRYWPIIEKPGGPNGQKFYFYEPRQFDEITLLVSERWFWFPAIWRKSFIWQYWNFSQFKSNHDLNQRIKNNDGMFEKYMEWDCNWCEDKIGSYLLDGRGKDPWINAYLYHLCPYQRHDRKFL